MPKNAAPTKKVFVHKYKWSHDKRRDQLRKLKKLGIARVLCNLHDGWLYECPADTVVAATR